MDPIKEAFRKAKQDIFLLQSQIQDLKNDIKEIKRTLQTQTQHQTHNSLIQTHTGIPTHIASPEVPKYPNSYVSTGNEGVQTDRQTNRQTDRHIQKFAQTPPSHNEIDHLDNVSEVLNSLDSLKKEVRYKFKKLTSQEMLIFSTIYQLEEEGHPVDYKIISSKIGLSESSIRDYVQKIIKKGIPVDKTKQDNKKILLSIRPDLKKIASLQTIIQLRALKI